MIIKLSKKWRLTSDGTCWIIQERKWKQKPPNDWVNKYYFEDLKNVFSTFIDLGIKDEKIKDLRGVVGRIETLKRDTAHAIEALEKEFGISPPKSEQYQAVAEANKQRKKRKKPKVGGKKKTRNKK